MTAEIRVYPSLIRTVGGEPVQPIETHRASGTLGDWLSARIPGYAEAEYHPIVVEVSGRVVPQPEWATLDLSAGAVVDIRPLPQRAIGRAVSSIIGAAVDLAQSVLGFLIPSAPDHRGATSGEQGSSIYTPNAQANTPKLGQPIPEIAGRHLVYPDYLSPPRRYFVDPKTMALDVMLCVGVGEHEISPDDIRIGQTRVAAFGGAVNYSVFGPGESVTGHQAHRHWYVAPEVGGTTGSAGLRLQSERDLDQRWTGQLAFSGDEIEAASGQSPAGWAPGVGLQVQLPIEFTVSTGTYNTFVGYFRHLMPSVGARVDLLDANGERVGHHRVAAWAPGSGSSPDNIQFDFSWDQSNWVPLANWSAGTYTRIVRRLDGSGNQPVVRIQNLDDGVAEVTFELDGNEVMSWPGWPSVTTSDAIVELHSGFAGGIWSNIIEACPPGKTTSRIEIDIFAQRGLCEPDDQGNLRDLTRTIEFRYRPVGGGAWTTVTETVTARTRDQIGWTIPVDLPGPMRPEVQTRRVESESNDAGVSDQLDWYGLRCELPAASSYPGATTIAMTITGSHEIASQSENRINVVAHRILPRLSGGTGATRSIADWMRHVAHSVGYTDADLDIERLEELDTLWSGRGDWFDFVHDSEGTVKEVLDRCLRAGFAELTHEDGLLSAVRDEPRSQIEQMYTPQNMTEEGLTRVARLRQPGEIDGVDVEYFDGETWSWEPIECRLPGDEGFRAEQMRVEGVTSRTRAWRIGMRERRRQRYVRWQYQFGTPGDALNSSYLSYCAVAGDVSGYAQSAMIESVEVDGGEVHILSSEPLDWASDQPNLVWWRRPDGSTAGPWEAIRGDDDHHLIAEMGEVPEVDLRHEPPHLLFGQPFAVLIRSIEPGDDGTVNVAAENYDERVYADDDGEPE